MRMDWVMPKIAFMAGIASRTIGPLPLVDPGIRHREPGVRKK